MALMHFSVAASLPVAASFIDQPILVAAAGLVVVLAIILVFVMVIRSNGASRRTSMGLGFDPQQGPLGQPRSGPSVPNPYQRSGGPSWNPGGDPNAFGQGGQQGATPGVWGQRYDGPPSGAPSPWAAPGGQAPAQAPWGTQPGYGGGGSRPMTPSERGMPGSAPGWDALGQSPSGSQQPWGAGANGQNNPWGQEAGAAAPWGGAPTPMPPSARPYGGAPSAPMPGGGSPGGSPWGAPQAGGGSAFEQQPYGQSAGGDPRSARPAGRVGALEVRSDKDRGRVYELRKDRTTIGRSRDSDIFLDDLAVSRLHLVILRDDQGRYVLHDENSANGVYVNGQRVMRDQLLEDGDEVQVGQVVLAFGRR
jgi:FHA domain